MFKLALLSAIVLMFAMTACGPSRGDYEAALAEKEALAVERDSLLTEVLETMRFATDVNTEMARASGLVGAEAAGDPGVPGAERDRAEREATLGRVRTAIDRLNAAEEQLERARVRIRQLQGTESRLLAQVEEYQNSLAELRQAIEAREAELTMQIAALSERVDTLTVVAEALTDTVRTLAELHNTAYVAIGTRDELMQRGVIVQEGSKFLFFGSRRLEPARDLDPSDFKRIDINEDTVIQLPDPERPYRILTRHNPEFLDPATVENGHARGELRIKDPGQFWTTSRFLILVRG